MSDPVDFRTVALELLRVALKAGDLPREAVEEAAAKGNELAQELLDTTPNTPGTDPTD